MEELYDFVKYNEAFALKKIGFAKPCFSAYRNTDGEEKLMGISKWTNFADEDTHEGFCAAPSYKEAFNWLRDKYGLVKSITPMTENLEYFYVIYQPKEGNHNQREQLGLTQVGFKTHEEAESHALKKMIELIKEFKAERIN